MTSGMKLAMMLIADGSLPIAGAASGGAHATCRPLDLPAQSSAAFPAQSFETPEARAAWLAEEKAAREARKAERLAKKAAKEEAKAARLTAEAKAKAATLAANK